MGEEILAKTVVDVDKNVPEDAGRVGLFICYSDLHCLHVLESQTSKKEIFQKYEACCFGGWRTALVWRLTIWI